MICVIALPHALSAQTRLSLGAGAGIAGSTDASLSEGKSGPVVMGQLTRLVLPFVELGGEVEYWRHSSLNVTFATGVVQVHVPSTGLFVKAGAGYGTGDADGRGRVSGVAGQVGLGYDITIPASPIGFTLFGNGSLAYGTARSFQLVDGGLAITFR